MAEIIDLGLLSDARRILGKLLDRHGIAWFMARESDRLMALEQSHVENVIKAAVEARRRKGFDVPPKAVEHCRKQVRRELIRRVAEAMVATGM